uniref:Uncharacterized protein n=1 Tax=Anguilla anguilla TaxID=7936 RepID=A0A0E9UWE0_ANGAN
MSEVMNQSAILLRRGKSFHWN